MNVLRRPKRTSGRARLAAVLVGVALAGSCLDVVIGNHLSFNLRAMSSEGRSATRCLSTADATACQWTGWKSWQQLKGSCPQVACMDEVILGQRYALQRPRPGSNDVLALGVDVYDVMVDDLWLGDGGTPLHCIDATRRPGVFEALLRGSDRQTFVRRSDDPRCAAVANVPAAASLRAEIIGASRR